MTAVAVDPVEALAKVLKAVREDTWSDAEDLARAALAHARGLVPGRLESQIDEGPSASTRAWNACRAETLRRLGGEGA